MAIYLAHTYEYATRTDPNHAAWFDPKLAEVDATLKAAVLADVERWGRKHFGAVNMQRTPTGFGMELLRHALPEDAKYEQLPAGISDILHGAVSLPHRFELFRSTPKGQSYEHDARVAFLAHCRRVPVYLHGHFIADSGSEYLMYRQGWYKATVTVPATWKHIGLVPSGKVRIGQQDTYSYPRTPGESFTYWFSGTEIHLLKAHGWPVEIHNRILFAAEEKGLTGLDPLRRWQEVFVTAIMEAEKLSADSLHWQLFRSAIRSVALHTIGMFNFNGKAGASSYFNGQQWVEVAPAAATPYTLRFHHPEWWAAITARTRVATTRLALQVPLAQLSSIKGDAVVTTLPIDGIADTGKVGAYRLKGRV